MHALPRAHPRIQQRSHIPSMKLLPAFLIPVLLCAQQTVAPAPDEKVGPVRGENTGDYNVVQSWELGYRFASIGDDDGKYRSDVNYRDGVRLLSSYLTVNSKDGR